MFKIKSTLLGESRRIMRPKKLLSFENAKTVKGESLGYLTAILYMAPGKESGVNLCPSASPGCLKSCLYTAGMGVFSNVKAARVAKARYFIEDRTSFLEQLKKETRLAQKRAVKAGMKLVVRLNGTTDIAWERHGIIESFPDIQFYDYTAIFGRINLPSNYHLTFSRKENNEDKALKTLQLGLSSVAVVFGAEIPATWNGFKVVSGDKHDLRFLDPKDVVIGLTAKGPAKKDLSGFVVRESIQLREAE